MTRNLQRTRSKLKNLLHNRTSANNNKTKASSGLAAGLLFASPVSVVTTVDASDWSLQVRMDAPLLQSKRPMLRGVMAACVGNVQWSPVEDNTSSIRSAIFLKTKSILQTVQKAKTQALIYIHVAYVISTSHQNLVVFLI